MKLRFITATISVLLAGIPGSAQATLRSTDPFFIENGSSFSASSAHSTRKKPLVEPAKVDGIVSDVEEALSVIRRSYVDRKIANGDKAVNSAVRSMLKSLDPHSNFFDAAEFAELLGEHRSEYSGSGSTIMNFKRNGEIETHIVAVTPGSPAAEAGLSFGDRIISVDGHDVSGMSSLRVREMVRGPRGTSVNLIVERAATRTVAALRIRREKLPQPTVPHAFVLAEGTGYIDMTVGFSYTTVSEFDASLQDLKNKGITSLIIDLRGNGGGLVDQAVAVAERFLPAGRPIVSQRGRNPYEDRNWRSANEKPETMPLVLLVDGNTASAAEIVAGAMQDNDRALIVGARTFGKGLVQNVLELDNGSGLTLTAARYYTPSGRSIQRDYSDGSLYEYFAHTDRAASVDRPAFVARTRTDRPVYGGDGIAPDIQVAAEDFDQKRSDLVDKVYFFARELLEGRIGGESARPGIRRAIMFGEDPADGAVVAAFYSYIGSRSESSASNEAFTISQIRYFICLGAFGTNEAQKALISHDVHIKKATESIPAAAELSGKAQSLRR